MSLRLFVGNLSYDVTESELRTLFSEVGTVTVVRVPLDRESGRHRGFAFVDFAERIEGQEAINRFHQAIFKGRALAVSEAVAREDVQRPAPRGDVGMRAPMRSNEPASGPIVRNFGPDALPRNKRRPENRGGGEKGPKAALKESKGGRAFGGGLADDEAHGSELVPFWAVDDDKQDSNE